MAIGAVIQFYVAGGLSLIVELLFWIFLVSEIKDDVGEDPFVNGILAQWADQVATLSKDLSFGKRSSN